MHINNLVTDSIKSELDNASCFALSNTNKGICLTINNAHGTCELSLFGGHVLSYIAKSDSTERLWLSKSAVFDGNTPIRGGIPICWPWFSAHHQHEHYPSHGFVRTQFWKIKELKQSTINHSSLVVLTPLKTDLFGYKDLHCELQIEVGEFLDLRLTTTNTSQSTVRLSQALHTYFRVSDINNARIEGLSDHYFDKLQDTHKNPCPRPYKIQQEVDRIHAFAHLNYSAKQHLQIIDDSKGVKRELDQSGHDSTVVWNPWDEKSQKMVDMDNTGYRNMLCIESANTDKADKPLMLESGQTHILHQKIY